MKILKLVFFNTIFCFSSNCLSQFTVDSGFTGIQMAQALTGGNIAVSNVNLACSHGAYGVFNFKGSSFGMKSGIVLTTGRSKTFDTCKGGLITSNCLFSGLNGPSSYFASKNNFVSVQDSYLMNITTGNQFDRCRLEFDFVPLGDTVRFNYIFGSEEYPTYNCTQFNDAFGIFLSGPGISGVKNVALVPGTTIPVCINSINNATSTLSSFSRCTAMGAGSPFGLLYVNNSTGVHMTYNGYTRLLTGEHSVTPTLTYHVAFAIADIQDGAYDSGVFIEGSSLVSNTLLDGVFYSSGNITSNPNYIVEGCSYGKFVFYTSKKVLDSFEINLSYSGNAISGVDYSSLPSKVFIPKGDSVVSFNVNGILDQLVEPFDSIIVYANAIGYNDSFTIQIKDVKIDTVFIYDTFCAGSKFYFAGDTFENSVVKVYNHINSIGCDSIVKLSLFVKSASLDTIRLDSIVIGNICSSNNKTIYLFPLNIDLKNKYTKDWGAFYQSASIFYNLPSGDYHIRIKRGCAFLDTLISLPYKVSDTLIFKHKICKGDSFKFQNIYYTQKGLYKFSYKNRYSCDSFRILNLEVGKVDTFKLYDTICNGDFKYFDNRNVSVPGIFVNYSSNNDDCDSTTILYLIVKRRDTMIHNRSICQGDTLNFSGNRYTEAGSYKLSHINKQGCDSFVHLNLSIKRRDSFSFYDTICRGSSKMFEGIAHKISGKFVYKLTNREGCDSFRILNLVVQRQDTHTLKYAKCIDDSVIHGGVTYKTTGIHNKLYKNIFNCDSLVILDLKFSNFEIETITKSICPGDSYEGYKLVGTHHDTIKRKGKCDSIRELILSHTPIPITKLSPSICKTKVYTYRSKSYSQAGVYYDTILTSRNCDSIIEIGLTVFDTSFSTLHYSICKNETYLFNNQYLSQPGIYKDTSVNHLGCDSFIYLTLGYRPPIYDSVRVEKCFGESYRGYTKTGTYRDTIQTAIGCDSILKINLKILAGPYPFEQKLEDCKSILFKNKLYTNSILIHDTLYNKLSCDSVYRKTNILIRPKPQKGPLEYLTFCDSIRMSDGKVYRFNFSYQDTIKTKDALACDSLYLPKQLEKKTRVNLTISVIPKFDEYFKGEKVELTTYPAKKLFWTTGDTIAKIKLVLNEDQMIEVIGWDSEECKDTAAISLRVIEPGLLDIPNAFAPSGMPENRIFKPNFKGMVEITRFEIYNRWGEKIYSTNTKDNIGWDGTYKGEDVPSGLFSYLLEYKVNRHTFFKSGEVLLVR